MADDASTYTFKAETRQLLNILIHSLYKEREIFLRELISNASDALNRLRFEALTEQNILEPDAELCIRLSVDEKKKLVTIEDTGIGMTKDELVKNLGTIAQSGAKAFLEAAKDAPDQAINVIGQFGVGFYSIFMVAEWVRVTSRSFNPRAKAASWYATGDDSFQVEPAEKANRGTRIEIKLKKDAAEFADESRLRTIVKRHSDFIGFPIYIGDSSEQVNQQAALWRTPRKDVSEEQYNEFYRQLTLEFEEPQSHLHITTDAPVRVYAILYIPAKAERGMFSLRKEDGLKLYSRNILIDEYSKDLLPEHFRFIQGVVDSEDLPLNVSRETFQASNMIARLKKVLTGQVMGALRKMAKKDREAYARFWKEFGPFIKQGVATDPAEREHLYELLRFKTSLQPDDWSSLDEYIERMQAGRKEIYYIVGDDDRSVLLSPHLDQFKSKGIEVLLLTHPVDPFLLMGLQKYRDFDLKNAAQAELEPDAKEDKADQAEAVTEGALENLINRFKEQLGDKITAVRETRRLSSSVARLVDPEGSLAPEMQRVYKYLDRETAIPKKILELNPSHAIIRGLADLEAGSDLEKAIIDQIYESALLLDGIHPDPSSMTPRIQQLMEAALKK
ncbi:MAG: molecular chaperone HtpG [Anaerolineales bacterium]|nr:molecular chaperone HtpG [Anaerolineales bacterium]